MEQRHKFFGPDGLKLPDEVEESIGRRLGGASGEVEPAWGRERRPSEASGAWRARARSWRIRRALREFAVKSVDGSSRFTSWWTAPTAPLVDDARGVPAAGGAGHRDQRLPDGDNINVGCGSTHPEAVQRAVAEAGADLGLPDGDADGSLPWTRTGAG